MPFLPRIHFFEINDQPWWPQYLREKVQDGLTLAWTLHFPILQPNGSPASLLTKTLSRVLGDTVSDYTYVDFASGAGGPIPYVERQLNNQLRQRWKRETKGSPVPVKFVLTDLAPHTEAWKALKMESENLEYVAESVDAANAPRDLLDRAGLWEGQEKKVMRLFSLAFHHFDDALAGEILRNTVETADGFAIFELQQRTFPSFFTCTLNAPMMWLFAPSYFGWSPGHLIFTYLIPLLPLVLVLDGYVSCLRTRTPGEVATLLERYAGVDAKGWRFMHGKECHTWPTGYMSWIICVKET